MNNIKVDEFIQHCIKLNFPPNTIPDSDYLKKIFSSHHCPILDNFVERVKHKDEIKLIRDNLLVSSATSGQLEKSLNFIKIRQLKAKLEDVKQKSLQMEKKEKKFFHIYNEKNMRLRKLRDEMKEKETLIGVLEAKQSQVEKRIESELENGKKVSSAMPVLKSPSNTDEIFETCRILLEEFYNKKSMSDIQEIKLVRKKIEDNLKTLSNASIFESVMRSITDNGEQIKCMKYMLNQNDSLCSSLSLQLITELNFELAQRGINALELKKRIANAKEMCNINVENFSKKLIAHVSQSDLEDFEFEDEYNECVEEFLCAVIANLKVKGANKKAKEIMDSLNSSLDCESKNEKFSMALQQSRELSNFTSAELLNSEKLFAQMHKILEKINIVKMSNRQKAFEIQSINQKNEMSRTMMNALNVYDSIDLPTYDKEFTLFRNISIDKFKSTKNSNSRLIDGSFITSLPMETVELLMKTNCNIENIHEFKKSLDHLVKTHTKSKEIFASLEPTVKVHDNIPIEELKDQNCKNQDKITELTDEIAGTNKNIKKELKECQQVYDYILINPLTAYVPSTITLDGKTFAEYEKEIKMYMRALKN